MSTPALLAPTRTSTVLSLPCCLLGLLLTAVLSFGAHSAVAQTDAPGVIEGTVRTADGTALPGATVAIRLPSDAPGSGRLIGGSTSASDGTFSIGDLPLRTYTVAVSFVGYDTQTRSVRLSAARSRVNVKPVHLQPSTSEMDGVEVTASRAALTMEGSARIYSFAGLEAALATKSASDLLMGLTAVDVDVFSGSLSLRGNGSVALHINGRPVSYEGQSLVQYLASLPAENVKRVEIQPNPSAKHDASGTAGIINIVMKETRDRGWSGGVSGRGGTLALASGAGHAGYRAGPWKMRAEYSLFRRDSRYDQDMEREGLGTSSDLLLDQASRSTRARRGHNASLTVDYDLAPQTSLSLASSGHVNRRASTRTITYAQRGTSGDDVRAVQGDWSHQHVTERLTLDHAWSDEDSAPTLSADVTYDWRLNRDDFFETQSLTGMDRRHGDDAKRTNTVTAQVDVERPSATWTLETGLRSRMRVLSQNTNQFALDGLDASVPTQTLDLQLRDAVHAGYALTKRSFGDVGIEVGLRGEWALVDVITGAGTSVNRQYASLFPSASVTYQPSKKQSLGLSYTKRVDRPAVYQLTNHGTQDDPYARRVGNPNLEPEWIHKMELTYLRHAGPATITISPFGQHVVNDINWRTSVIGDTLTVRRYENYASSTSLGMEVGTSASFGKKWKAKLSSTVYRRDMTGSALNGTTGLQSLILTARGAVTWKPRSGMHLQMSQYYRAPTRRAGGERQTAYYRTRFSAQQSFWGKKATVGLRVADPFDLSEMQYVRETTDYREQARNDWSGRRVTLSFSYQFSQNASRSRR